MQYSFFVANFFRAASNYLLILSLSNNMELVEVGNYFYYFAVVALLSIGLTLGSTSIIARTSYREVKCRYFFNVALAIIFFNLTISAPVQIILGLSFSVVLYALAKALELCFEAFFIASSRNSDLFSLCVGSGLINCLIAFLVYKSQLVNADSVFLVYSALSILLMLIMYLISGSSFNIFSLSIFKHKSHFKLKFVSFSLVAALANGLLVSGDRIVLGNLIDKESLAIYSLLYTVIFALHRFFTLPYSQILARKYFKDKNDEIFKRKVLRGVLFLCVLLMCNVLFLSQFYQLLGLDRFYLLECVVLSCAVVFSFLYINNLTKCKSAYDSLFMIKSQLLSAIIVIVGNIILTPVYGWFAAVIMTAGGYVFACIFTIKYSAFNVKRSKL